MKGFRYNILLLLFGFSVKLAEAQPSPPPVISINGFTGNIATCYGSASTSLQQFNVSGSNLTGSIILTLSSPGFQISLNNTSGFDTILLLNPSLGIVKTTSIYVRSSALAAVGNLTADVVVSTDGAITQNIPVAASIYAYPDKPTITTGGATTICSGNSVTLTSSAVNGNQWYLNDTIITGATNGSYIVKSTGNYTVMSTLNGCSSSKSEVVSIKVNPTPSTPVIATNGATTICSGDVVTLTSSATSGNQWYLNDTAISSAISSLYDAKISGNYTVISTLNGCSSSKSQAIFIKVNLTPSTPLISTTDSTTICSGNSVTLVSSALSGNQWYLNDTMITGATSGSYIVKSTGSYTVVSTLNGCSSPKSKTVSITVNPTPSTPVISTNGVTTICSGNVVTLTSNAASGNQWYLNDTAISGAISTLYDAKVSGNYTVMSTLNGCSSSKSSVVSITVKPTPAKPLATATGPTKICGTGSVTITSDALAGNQWFLNDTAISSATTSSYEAKVSGNYTVIVSVNGCSSFKSETVSVVINPIPSTPIVTAAGSTTICSGSSVTLASSALTGNQWYLNNIAINAASAVTYSAKDSGNYTVISTVNGCSSAKSEALPVTVNPLPSMPVINTGGAVAICGGTSLTLTSSVSTGNQWYLDGAPISLASATSYSASLAGAYTDTVTNSYGCKSGSLKTTVTINPGPPKPSINWNGIQFSTTAIATKYQWLLNDVQISGATSAVHKPSSIGNYKVQVVDNNGCASISDNFTLIVTSVNSPASTPNSHIVALLPNPATENVMVRFNQPPAISLVIQIIDPSGRILKQVATNNQYTYIPVAGINSGNYYLKIIGKSYDQTQQLIVSH